jgi:DNA-binding MarR family transcriptional regulator
MAELTNDEKAVLRALGELEPATVEEIAARTRIEVERVRQILKGLSKRGLLTSLEDKEYDSETKT